MSDKTDKVKRWQDFEKVSDFEITVGNKLFKVHRALLAWKSPHFEDLFETNQECRLKLADHDPDIFDIFLQYLYSEQIEDDDVSPDLFFVAVEFKVKALVKICEEILCKIDINKENVIKIFIAAVKCDCENLKQKSFVYLKKNYPYVENSDLIVNCEEAVNLLFDVYYEDSGYLNSSIEEIEEKFKLINGEPSGSEEAQYADLTKDYKFVLESPKMNNNWNQWKLSDLLDSSKFSDLSLVVGEAKFKVHKIILMLKSFYFENQINSDSEEINNQNVLFVEDVTTESFKSFLKYLYTDLIDSENLTIEFLQILHKFTTESKIIDICSLQLLNKMTETNAIHIFKHFCLYNIDFAKYAAVDFLVRNFEKVSENTEFQDVIDNYLGPLEIIVDNINSKNKKFSGCQLDGRESWNLRSFDFYCDIRCKIFISNDPKEKKIHFQIRFEKDYNSDTFNKTLKKNDRVVLKAVLFSKTKSTVYIEDHQLVYDPEGQKFFVLCSTVKGFEGFEYFDYILLYFARK